MNFIKNTKDSLMLRLFALCVAIVFFANCKHGETTRETPPIKVEIMAMDTVIGDNIRTYVGEIEENMSFSLGFVAGGKVEKVLVHEGDYVREGQLLVTINRSNAQSAYNSAKAQLEQAEDAYNRLKKVYEQGSIAEVKWVEMQTNLEKARSLEQIAKKQLDECELYAPSSGVVSSCNAKAGVSLLPAEPAVTLLDINSVSVKFSVPEDDIYAISLGKNVDVIVPALDNLSIKGKISEKSLTSNPVAHSYQVKVALPNGQKKLLPGMVCKVYLNQRSEVGFVIPSKAVQTRPEGLGIWVVEKGMPVRRLIEVSEYVANGVLVSQGVDVGDTIIVAGQQKLYNGAQICWE